MLTYTWRAMLTLARSCLAWSEGVVPERFGTASGSGSSV